MPTKSTNTGGRGGARPGAGRKKKSTKESIEKDKKIKNSKSTSLSKSRIPTPHEFVKREQKDGDEFQANAIFRETWEWLESVGCASKVASDLIERYAVSTARWIQCEEITSQIGFLSKHPTTSNPIPSPFVNIGINYMNQAARFWNEIFQIVKENSSESFGNQAEDDFMEVLLRKKNKK